MASTMRLFLRDDRGSIANQSRQSLSESESAFVELLFQLLDDVGVHLLGDLHLEQEYNAAQDDDSSGT